MCGLVVCVDVCCLIGSLGGVYVRFSFGWFVWWFGLWCGWLWWGLLVRGGVVGG